MARSSPVVLYHRTSFYFFLSQCFTTQHPNPPRLFRRVLLLDASFDLFDLYLHHTLFLFNIYIGLSSPCRLWFLTLTGDNIPHRFRRGRWKTETTCLMYTTTSLSMTRRTWKNQKDRFTGHWSGRSQRFLLTGVYFYHHETISPYSYLLFEHISFLGHWNIAACSHPSH